MVKGKQNNWIEQFDKKFGIWAIGNTTFVTNDYVNDIKRFITKERAMSYALGLKEGLATSFDKLPASYQKGRKDLTKEILNYLSDNYGYHTEECDDGEPYVNSMDLERWLKGK